MDAARRAQVIEMNEAFRAGMEHHQSGRFEQAIHCYGKVLEEDPSHVDALNLLGVIFYQQGEYERAADSLQRLVQMKPDVAQYRVQLSRNLQALSRYEEAEKHSREVVRMKPGSAESLASLGAILLQRGRMIEAEEVLRQAIRLKPQHAPAHFRLATVLLVSGRWREGWEEQEWRWGAVRALMPDLVLPFDGAQMPLWAGEPLKGRTILLLTEQGFGDSFQFCRYIPWVAQHGRVILRVSRELKAIFSQFLQLPNVERLVTPDEPYPDADLYCPLLSLPRAFGTTLENLPPQPSYLRADATRVEYWKSRLANVNGVRVGFAWSGAPRKEMPFARDVDRLRSVPLAVFAPLLSVSGVSFVSLQKGPASAQVKQLPDGLFVHDWTAELDDFAETAALVEALDIVISVDTAVVHLAAALGKRTWLLNRFETCWRWLLGRSDSPWYPTLRQFRQPSTGDWTTPAIEMRSALIDLVEQAKLERTAPGI